MAVHSILYLNSQKLTTLASGAVDLSLIPGRVKLKSNLHYIRGITQKRVASGEAHLRGLAPGLHSSEERS